MNFNLNEADLSKVKLVLLDFDGVFTNNCVYTSENGIETVRSSRLDGIGLQKIKSLGLTVIIISSEKNLVVTKRAEKLQLECFQGVQDKAMVVKDLMRIYKTTKSQTLFMGNDVNDIPAFKEVGISVAVKDSWPDILPFCDLITSRNGGNGAVRELCEKISNDIMSKR